MLELSEKKFKADIIKELQQANINTLETNFKNERLSKERKYIRTIQKLHDRKAQ